MRLDTANRYAAACDIVLFIACVAVVTGYWAPRVNEVATLVLAFFGQRLAWGAHEDAHHAAMATEKV